MNTKLSRFSSESFQNHEKEAFEALAEHFNSRGDVYQTHVTYDAYEDGIDRDGNRIYTETDTPLNTKVNTPVDIPDAVSDEAVRIGHRFNLRITTDTIPGAYSQIIFKPMN